MQMRDLNRQYEAMKAEMNEALMRVAASGSYIMGHEVEELEARLAAYVGVKHCITCANGTDALRLALMAMGIGKGDAVFVPDFTFFATAEAVALVGATPIFVDVDGRSFNISPDSLQEAIEQLSNSYPELRAAAVIAVDLFGQPANYDALRQICNQRKLYLIEDGAQGFGGSIGNKRACSFGDISTTSFFPAKPLGCYGDGGALFTDNDNYAALLRSLRVHGKGADKYDNVRLGLNSRLDTMQAAVLQVKLNHFEEELVAVNRVAEKYSQLLADKVRPPVVQEGMASSWAQYTILVEGRDALQEKLCQAAVPTAIYYPRTMSQQTAFSNLGQEPCRVAASICRQALSLPMHPYLTDEEIELIATSI